MSDSVVKTIKDKNYLKVAHAKPKSAVWSNFVFLHCAKSQEYTGYVLCTLCDEPLKHDRGTSGTSHLRNHSELYCKAAKQKAQQGQGRITGFFNTKVVLPVATKTKLLDASMSYVVKDIRPFSAMEGGGMEELANVLIEIGAKHGRVPAADILPSRFTVKRHACKKSDESIAELKENLKIAIRDYGCIGITTDVWTDLRSRSFLSLTFHFTMNDRLISLVATVRELTESKTGDYLRRNILSACSGVGLDAEVIAQRCYFTTDNGSNIKLALAMFNRLPCACHMISTTLTHILQLNKMSTVYPTEQHNMSLVERIRSTVESIKSLAAYFKRSGLNNKLQHSIKQSNDTRWNSTLIMLQSFHDNKEEVSALLKSNGQEHRLENIDYFILKTLITFLEEFKNQTLELEGELDATIHKVYLSYNALKDSMQPSPTDTLLTQFLKDRGLRCLIDKFEITDMHRLGFFLNPKFKGLVPLSAIEKNKVHEHARSLMSSFFTDHPDVSHNTPEEDHAYISSKKQKIAGLSLDDRFLNWQEEVITGQYNPSADEVTKYIQTNFSQLNIRNICEGPNINLLRFWSDTSVVAEFPILSKLAIGVLSIPASSSPSERVFSACGNTLTKKRSRLSPRALNSVIVLGSFMKNMVFDEVLPSTSHGLDPVQIV